MSASSGEMASGMTERQVERRASQGDLRCEEGIGWVGDGGGILVGGSFMVERELFNFFMCSGGGELDGVRSRVRCGVGLEVCEESFRWDFWVCDGRGRPNGILVGRCRFLCSDGIRFGLERLRRLRRFGELEHCSWLGVGDGA